MVFSNLLWDAVLGFIFKHQKDLLIIDCLLFSFFSVFSFKLLELLLSVSVTMSHTGNSLTLKSP